MPDLLHTLQGNDLGFLKMVANTWGIDFNAPDARTGLVTLTHAMLDAHLANEVVDALPEGAHQVLQALADGDGRLLWAAFIRQFGEVRSMGPAKRDRERPDLRPASPAELLWYRGLVGRAFVNTDSDPQEFAY
ncbi:MAG: hypothetical protein HGA86_02270, partial [Anaerolineaceae bacterium]|nr:hypothetical protein [Anaerolineaceae bacterium]